MRLGIIGYGNIGATLVRLIGETGVPVTHLTVLTRPGSAAAARELLAGNALPAEVVSDTPALLEAHPGLVVECAGHEAAATHVPPVLQAGLDAVVVSVGALADPGLEAALAAAATEGGARLILPPGAIGGVDLLAALGAAGGLTVRYRGTKPPAAWAGTPAERAVNLQALTEPAVFFTGTAREAARAYPKNANVAATLALAGAGFDATQVALVADPAATGNTHAYEVESPLARYSMTIGGAASANARTSATTVWSVLREIRNRIGPVAI